MPEPVNLDPDFRRQPIDPLAWTPPRFLRRHAARTARRRALRRLGIGALAALLAIAFLFTDGGLASILWRRFRIHRLEQQVATLERRRQWLQQETQRRKKDPATIERIAREEYGMVYPGETLIRVVRVSEKQARRVEKERDAVEKERDAAETAAR